MVLALLLLSAVRTQVFEPVKRGSWIANSKDTRSFPIVDRSVAEIVVDPSEPENVRQAAHFLAGDIEKITGKRPEIVRQAGPRPNISLVTRNDDSKWEAFHISVSNSGLTIVGSNPRGTAFGAYELCERLGTDPLYIWTGYSPPHRGRLRVKAIEFDQAPPVVKFRGLFHDDEDILPRPLIHDKEGREVTDANATVPKIWYERYFETALRLKMNMVAPWVRVQKPFEIQKMASDWGLYYTSHHYDTLLSDPYHFTRSPNLAERRGVRPEWDYVTNREGMIRFWQGGVDENRNLDCIWPIGMRGTNDYSYKFPAAWTEDQRIGAYNDALQTQVDMVKRALPPEKAPLFHFTMYTEMLPYYQTGKLRVPKDAMIIWPDNNDGVMRALPSPTSSDRSGVYYHLAYFGGNITKQLHQIVPPDKISRQFAAIDAAHATDYVLVNVSELREYVMGIREIAGFEWSGLPALSDPLGDWCREYFPGSERETRAAYDAYFALMPTPGSVQYGASKVVGAIQTLEKKLDGQNFSPALPDTLPTLRSRSQAHQALHTLLQEAKRHLSSEQKRFFFENLELAADMDRLPTEAAILLVQAIDESDPQIILGACHKALESLNALDRELRKAERPPFERWYGRTWIDQRNTVTVDGRDTLIKLLMKYRR